MAALNFFQQAVELWGENPNTEITPKMASQLELLGIQKGKDVSCDGVVGEAFEAAQQKWNDTIALLSFSELCSAGAGPGCNANDTAADEADWFGLKTVGTYGVYGSLVHAVILLTLYFSSLF